jgi:cobalt-zinc-cadmium efflux system protein
MTASHGHTHDHAHAGHSHTDPSATTRKLVIALQINFVFLLIEAIGGWYTNSLALLSDAGHMLTDVGALALALGARWLASRPATASRSFGFRRAEVLAAFLNAITLWAIVGGIVWEGIERINRPESVGSGLMVVIAFLGLAANLISAWMLSGSHGDINVRGAYLHLMADALGSVGALVAGVAMLWGVSPVIDPIASMLIAGLVFWGSLGLMRQSVNILMEATPAGINVAAISRALANLPGVREVHDLHIWQIGSGLVSLTGHLVVHNQVDRDLLLMQAQGLMRSKHGIDHVTLQTETAELHRFLTTEEQTVSLQRKRPLPPDV